MRVLSDGEVDVLVEIEALTHEDRFGCDGVAWR